MTPRPGLSERAAQWLQVVGELLFEVAQGGGVPDGGGDATSGEQQQRGQRGDAVRGDQPRLMIGVDGPHVDLLTVRGGERLQDRREPGVPPTPAAQKSTSTSLSLRSTSPIAELVSARISTYPASQIDDGNLGPAWSVSGGIRTVDANERCRTSVKE